MSGKQLRRGRRVQRMKSYYRSGIEKGLKNVALDAWS
jgi:hypothetical protein